MRKLGYIYQGDVDRLYKLNQHVPGLGEVNKLAERYSDTDVAVQSLGLDDDFDVAVTPELRTWAANNGVSLDVLRKNWRSHWSHVGPGEARTLWHRLRNDTGFGNGEQLWNKLV